MTELETFDTLLSLGVTVAETMSNRTGLVINLLGVSPLFQSELEWHMVFGLTDEGSPEGQVDLHIVVFPVSTKAETWGKLMTEDLMEIVVMDAVNKKRKAEGKTTFI